MEHVVWVGPAEPSEAPLLCDKIVCVFGMPGQHLGSITAYCDSWEASASVDDSFYGVASPQSCLPSLSPLVFSPTFGSAGHHRFHDSQLECRPSLHLSNSLQPSLAQRELELNPVWLLVSCSQPSLDKWQERLCQNECWSPSR